MTTTTATLQLVESHVSTHRLGDPQVAGPLAVFPVLGPQIALAFRSFAQAAPLGAVVRELKGGASVNDLLVDNPTDLPVLLYEGEELLGAQQNRTLDVSVLVAAGAKVTVPVSCLEQGRWDGSRHGERFAAAPHAADPSLRRVKRVRANLAAAAGRPGRPDQGEVWSEVRARLHRGGVRSPTGSLHDLHRARSGETAGLVAEVRAVEGQVGAVATIAGRPVALDFVARAEVFDSLLPRLARGYALEALGAEAKDPDEPAAEQFLRSALRGPRAVTRTPGLGRGLLVAGDEVTGAGLSFAGDILQLSAFPAQADTAGPQAASIARPSRRRWRRAR